MMNPLQKIQDVLKDEIQDQCFYKKGHPDFEAVMTPDDESSKSTSVNRFVPGGVLCVRFSSTQGRRHNAAATYGTESLVRGTHRESKPPCPGTMDTRGTGKGVL
jgi:hypothetical protein